jgi:hypothetical protein
MAGFFSTVSRVANQFSSLSNSIGSEFVRQVDNSKFGQTLNQVVGTARSISNVAQGVADFANALSNPASLISGFRSRNIFSGAEPESASRVNAQFASGPERDWRVRLSIPAQFTNSPILTPLKRTFGFVFPFTPTIYIQHSADYNMLQPVHSNYPFPVYQNSRTDQFTISGEFLVENSFEAEYWVAAVQYLRTLTKMDYGGTGAPPPVVRLNGYGDFVFNNVPVVVTNFQIDLPSDVDYISTQVGGSNSVGADAISWVPAQSLIAVTLQPVYSRRKVEQFNLQDFVNGNYISGGDGFI